MEEFINSGKFQWVTFIVIILITILIAYLFNRYSRRVISHSAEKLKLDTTRHHFLRHSFSAIIYLIGISLAIYAIPSLRSIANSLLAGAGIAGIALGFAAKDALGNIIGGVFIIIFQPFKIGSRIQIQQLDGIVEDITLRHTVIRNFQNKRIIIPNAIISTEVIINSNLVEDKIVKWIEVGISYDSDIDKAKELMRDEVLKHEFLIDNRSKQDIKDGVPKVPVRVVMLGDFSVTLRAWAWAKDSANGFAMHCDLLESIKKRFDKEGIEIPFPYRTIVHKNKNEKS